MNQPLVIACVKWGERYGAHYVNMLYDMVQRHVHDTVFTFECFTEDAKGLHSDIIARALPGDLTSWWNKLYLFKEGVFAPNQRVAYFDLDTLIIGPLDDVLAYEGEFALLRDFYRPQGYGSGVMLWRGGACYHLWSSFIEAGKPLLAGGDQAIMEIFYTHADRLQDCFPDAFVSYKTECTPLPPAQARVVCFHGEPKQDNCDAAWVKQVWKPSGLKTISSDTSPVTLQEQWHE